MKLHKDGAEIYVPDGKPLDEALPRTTHMGISAHQDDIEFMAYPGILESFHQPGKGFMGVVVTNGAGSPRAGVYADCSDEDMQAIRKVEQKKAAFVGEYTAQALLMYSSAEVKDPSNADVVEDLRNIFLAAKPEVVFTHNLADKHDTHLCTALRVIAAIRTLPKEDRPKKIYGGEVWRNLDWILDEDKVVFDVSDHENLAAAVMGVFDSQISGGKRYDLATMGRRRAHATYYASHGLDTAASLAFCMDLTPLIEDDSLDINGYIQGFIDRFAGEVSGRIDKFGK